ncbi:MAG: DUF1579 domain-containing protein [Alphaproteobacteria bacterium]|nr:MAG: DUF1579 domain-containing protein [Alphaproteobacteria bacterium]
MMTRIFLGITLLLSLAAEGLAAESYNPAEALNAQKTAMEKLKGLEGTWRGAAWRLAPTGEQQTFTHTERVGPFLGGTLKIVEGRSYADDGSVIFNALGIISYDPASQGYLMRSYAMGHAGDFILELTDTGFTWSMSQGPMTMVHTATLSENSWQEVSEMVRPDGSKVTVFNMTLTREDDTDWPEAGAVAKDP